MGRICLNCGDERLWYDGKIFRCYRCDSPIEPGLLSDKEALKELEIYQKSLPMHFYDANVLSGKTVFLSIQAIKKRIPRRPHLPEIDAEYVCPSCGEILAGGKYCSDCGQKLDLD